MGLRGIVIVAAVAVSLQGCAGGVGLALLGVGAGTATSAGVDHTLSGIAYKTFTSDMDSVRKATIQALGNMAMKVETHEPTDYGYAITASAGDKVAEIELQKITRAATRMRVTVLEDNWIFRDSATSIEIILQTARNVDPVVADQRK